MRSTARAIAIRSTSPSTSWRCRASISARWRLLWCLPHGPLPEPLNWAAAAAIPVLLFYLQLSFSLFAGMAGLTALGLAFCHQWQGPLLWPAVAAFVLLWIAQFVGHKIEGKRPSFLADLQFLLIGPAWVLASLYRRLGIPY